MRLQQLHTRNIVIPHCVKHDATPKLQTTVNVQFGESLYLVSAFCIDFIASQEH